jgi:hypothetical protein
MMIQWAGRSELYIMFIEKFEEKISFFDHRKI